MINIDDIIKQSNNTSIIDKNILQPYIYIDNLPSNNQNIRSKFLNAFNELYFKINNQQLLNKIDSIISIFHNSSLLIDDIEDSSQYRRKHKTSHLIYGIPLTLNCGNLMYFKALQQSQLLSNDSLIKLKISDILINEMLNLHHGQGLDIYWRDYLITLDHLPSIQDYLNMVKDKTGGLFRLSTSLLNLFSEEKFDLIAVSNLLGILYQIRDDYLNLVDESYGLNKGIKGEDLIEGKLSLPILHCLIETGKSSPVYKLLYEFQNPNKRKEQMDLISECIKYMEVESYSLKFTQDLILQYKEKLMSLISKRDGWDNSSLIQIINHLCNV
ncbi:unnamed protein product [Candida verbasci]|uniref:Geranylgeranyl diphosphate synthase n=1 Tax=Candida verbasci TaxID=1227364 RepID=A0A9W4TZA2_9ASCO|nr:unnamed protein product [Candida verbasci]